MIYSITLSTAQATANQMIGHLLNNQLGRV